jgi:small-conductance mechanosensitive channel
MKLQTQRIAKHIEKVRSFELPKNWWLNRIIFLLLVFFLLFEGIVWLEAQGRLPLPHEFVILAQGIILITASFLVASVVIRLTSPWLFKIFGSAEDIEQVLLLKKLYEFMVYAGATTFILYKLGVEATNITLLAGLITTGLAFAVRDIIMSFMVWFMLLTKKPFRIGDYIRIGEDTGKVLHIGTFFVTLDEDPTLDGEVIKIPNKMFLEKVVQNYGKEGLFVDTVRVPFKDTPKDIEKRLDVVLNAVKSFTRNGDQPRVTLDTNNEWTHVLVRYPVQYDARQLMRTKVILAVRDAMQSAAKRSRVKNQP